MADYVIDGALAIPTIEEILDTMSAEQRADIDPNLDTSADSIQGQLNGVFARQLRKVWEAAKIAFDARDPKNAELRMLEAICELTGTRRQAATPSRFMGTRRVTVNLEASTTLEVGTLFAQSGNPLVQFKTVEKVISTSAGDYSVAAICTQDGPISCNAGTLIEIPTPVTGLNSVINDFDAVLGTLEDNDSQLLQRREAELNSSGNATPDAIESDLADLEIDGAKPILEVEVLENRTDVVDANGLPPHSYEPLVWDGVDAATPNDDIAQVIWDSGPCGNRNIGTTSGVATTRLGLKKTMYFSRQTQVPTKVEVTLVKITAKYPGDAAVKQAIVDASLTIQKAGRRVAHSNYTAVVEALDGVDYITSIRLGKVSGSFLPAFTNLTMSTRERATIDASNITLITS